MWANIRAERKAQKITQKQMAEKIGLHVNTYQRYERGDREMPANVLLKIADTLNKTTDELYGRTTGEKQFMENKQEILNLLLPALQATRNLYDLASLEYDPYKEIVIATFNNGHIKLANVAMDSGTAMITDTLRQII